MSLPYSAYLYYAVVKECKAIQLFSSRVDSDSVKSSGILMDKYANSDPSSCQRSTSWGFYINWIRPFHPTAIWSSPLKSFKRDLVVKFWKWIIFSDDQISNWNMWSRTASFWQATKTEFRSEKLDWFQEWNSRPIPLVPYFRNIFNMQGSVSQTQFCRHLEKHIFDFSLNGFIVLRFD